MNRLTFAGHVVVITGDGALGSAFAQDIGRRGEAVVVHDFGGPFSGEAGETSVSQCPRNRQPLSVAVKT